MKFRSRLLRLLAAPFLAFALMGLTSLEALFAPKAELWERWQANDPGSTEVLDYSSWNLLLGRFVRASEDGVNRIAYSEFGDAERQALDAFIDYLAEQPISTFNRDEQLAYWINLYNALTVKVVVDHGPVPSIRDIDISPGFFADGPWGKALVEVEGEALSLNDIEHRILRPIWQDPRIHYAVNCASIGCPNLRTEAFTGGNQEDLLEKAARDYVNHPRGASIADGKLTVSSIYVWFAADFGGSDAAILAHLKDYADSELKESLTAHDGIDDHAYDWTINGVTWGKNS